MNSSVPRLWTCSRCLRAQKPRGTSIESKTDGRNRHTFSTTAIFRDDRLADAKPTRAGNATEDAAEQGALSRRLTEMAEETMDTGGKSDRKLMQDAGFSEDLKKQLEERIAQTSFNAQNQRAASEVNMPVCELHTSTQDSH